MLRAAVRACEERVLAVEGDRPDGALDHVAVDLDAAIIQEPGEALPPRECIADRLGELGFLADQHELQIPREVAPRFRDDVAPSFRELTAP